MGTKVQYTIIILLLLFGLGTADALLVEREATRAMLQTFSSPASLVVQIAENTEGQSDDQEPADTEPVDGVAKMRGPDVDAVIEQEALEVSTVNEEFFITKIIPEEEAQVQQRTLLLDGDRAGAIAWTETPKVKIYYLALKEALHQSFTPAVTDLVDETQRREGFPPRNFLTFLDTGISEERIVFTRVRERLYEVHIAKDNEAMMFGLIDALTE